MNNLRGGYSTRWEKPVTTSVNTKEIELVMAMAQKRRGSGLEQVIQIPFSVKPRQSGKDVQ